MYIYYMGNFNLQFLRENSENVGQQVTSTQEW